MKGMTVENIADEIWNNKNSYFINAMGIRVKVFAFRHTETNKPYLSTSPIPSFQIV